MLELMALLVVPNPAMAMARAHTLSSAPRASLAATQPSIADFTRFHGMHVAPSVARSCIAAFDDGCIVFAPSSYASADFALGETSRFEVRGLGLLKYYLLVLASLTGLCTILGQTEIIDAREGAIEADGSHRLHPSPAILAYVEQRAGAPIRMVRRFEFVFRLVRLRVVMLHFASMGNEEKGIRPALHLVEVYEKPRAASLFLAPAAAAAGLAVLLARLLSFLT